MIITYYYTENNNITSYTMKYSRSIIFMSAFIVGCLHNTHFKPLEVCILNGFIGIIFIMLFELLLEVNIKFTIILPMIIYYMYWFEATNTQKVKYFNDNIVYFRFNNTIKIL